MARNKRLPIAAVLFLVLYMTTTALSQGSEYIFPHVADGVVNGDFYSTCFVLNNVFNIDNPVRFRFWRSNGTPWRLDLRSSDRGDLSGLSSDLSFTLRPRETVLIFTGGVDPLDVGWARLDADFPVLASEVFGFYLTRPTLRLGSEAGVLPSPTTTELSFPALISEDEPVAGTHLDTGFAVANPSGSTAVLTATLLAGDGTEIGQKLLTLNPNRHVSIFISEVFNDVQFVGQFHGTLRLSSNVNIAVVALRQTFGLSNTISTIEVTQDSETAKSIIYDREPNDSLETAQPIYALPAEIIGTMVDPNDRADLDLFSVSLTAGEVLYVFVVADLINSPLNDSIIIRNPSGAAVLEVDTFSAGLNDPFVRYQVPSDGIYYIDHGSVAGTSSRASNYRLHVMVK